MSINTCRVEKLCRSSSGNSLQCGHLPSFVVNRRTVFSRPSSCLKALRRSGQSSPTSCLRTEKVAERKSRGSSASPLAKSVLERLGKLATSLKMYNQFQNFYFVRSTVRPLSLGQGCRGYHEHQILKTITPLKSSINFNKF